MAVSKEDHLRELKARVLSLDDDELWSFVCELFPEASRDTIEDIYDALLSTARRDGPTVPAEEVFTDEDEKRGLSG